MNQAKILIVDDEPSVINMLKGVFDGMYLCEAATSGVQAMQMLQGEKFDLLITDVDLPDVSGLQLASLVSERWPELRCIAISGRIAASARCSCSQGEPTLLAKPIDISLIEEIVARLLAESAAGRGAE